ncbi:MAG TPA: M13 family metallopeptidase [Pyrinomonadaceae bacterium]|jgi:putative endopeptidase
MSLPKRRRALLALLVLLVALAAVSERTSRAALNEPADDPLGLFVDSQTGATGNGLDPANLDRSANACQDFNKFANGGWIARNPIPAAYPRWGTFQQLAERNRDALHQILEEAASNSHAARGSNERKIGDYYASCMDEAGAEAAGLKPLQPILDSIEQLKDVRGMQEIVARLHGSGVNALFNFGSTQDYKNSTRVIGSAAQGGLGLPDRDYYTNNDEKSQKIRAEYLTHITRMFELMGMDADTASARAKTAMAIETKLAESSMTRVQRRDPNAVYHKMTVAELKTLTPAFSWESYFQKIGLRSAGDVNVAQPGFFKDLDRLLTSIPLADWKTYLRWRLVDTAASALSSKFVEEDFNFKGRILTGTKENLPRWKRCVQSTDLALGEALGEVYVKKNFPPAAKARMMELVGNLIAALREDLGRLDWMGVATRKQAIAKLEAFARKIGYPETWRNYEALAVDRGSFLDNRFRAQLFEFNRRLLKIGRPVERGEWGMTPPTVNAYYSPSLNEIVFPAGILQAPFFSLSADDALNYGAIGAVIGHEMTHGFDDQGAKFDAEGNLKDWWTPEDLKNFQARTECVVNQFSSYVVDPKDNLRQNGKLVVGESVADLGGLTIAYAAYQKSLEGKPRPKNIDGFTPEQRFFLGYAQVWAGSATPEYERLQVITDPHPLPRFRVNGPLSNMPMFAQAFGCKPGDPMVRAERCQIW